METMVDLTAWRLIRSDYLRGAMNMALDDALLHAVAEEASHPILRLYRWQPPALSLGYAQSARTGVDLPACREAGIDVVRRPTGGRAVLHDHEVTYAIVAPTGGCFGSSVTQCYQVIGGVLKEMLQRLGLPAELVPGQVRGQQGRAVCFTAPAQYELVIDGCKVAGCAQKRRQAAFLQHGSVPVDLDLDLLQRIMPAATGEDQDSRAKVIGWLNRFSVRPLTVEAVEEVLITSFAAVLGIHFEESAPTEKETRVAERLCAEWYGNSQWTLGGPGWRGLSPGIANEIDGD